MAMANTGAHRQIAQERIVLAGLNPSRDTQLQISKFKENREYGPLAIMPTDTGEGVDPNIVVQFHNPARDENMSVFATCVGYIGTEEDGPQLVAYYLSAICCFFPNVKESALKALQDLGYTVTQINSNAERTLHAVDNLVTHSLGLSHVYLGQCIFVLFKNISRNSNNDFVLRRTNALKTHAGVPTTVLPFNAVPFDKAVIINGTLGSSYVFKQRLLYQMISIVETKDHLLKTVCNYICNILEWNEMTALQTIFNMLVLKESPVLLEPSIRHEAYALHEAFKVICQLDYPQYYRILGDMRYFPMLQRSKFITIFAVAKQLQNSVSPAMTNFKPLVGVNTNLVHALIELHGRYTRHKMDFILDF